VVFINLYFINSRFQTRSSSWVRG